MRQVIADPIACVIERTTVVMSILNGAVPQNKTVYDILKYYININIIGLYFLYFSGSNRIIPTTL